MKIFKYFHRYNHKLKKGIVLFILAWLCFSTIFMIAKLVENQTTVSTMLFFRNILGLFIITPWIIKRWPKSLEIKNFKIVVIRSVLGLLGLFFIFLAVRKISLVNATLLNNSAPFFVPIILWFWLRVPINHKFWPAIIAGFIGIALILKPDSKIFDLGAAYALISGICLAFTIIMMGMTSKAENLFSFLLYFFGIGVVLSLPFAILDWKIADSTTFIALLCLGILSLIGQTFLYYGLKYGKAHQLAPFTYSAVIFSGIYEWLIWGKVPGLIAYIGMFLIIASGVWIFLISRPLKE